MRVVLVLAVLALVVVGPRTPWGLVGLVFIATGLIGSCPLYTVLRISTRGKQDDRGAGGRLATTR